MKKRIPVKELLIDPRIGHNLQDLCEKNELLESDSLSDKLVRTLRLLTKEGVDPSSLSYSEIQDLARAAGISDNLSRTTIKQAREMLSVGGRTRDQSKTDMALYVVNKKLAGLFLMDDEQFDVARVHAAIADLIIPIVLLKAQYAKTPSKNFIKVAPYANKLAAGSNAGCELLMTLLENPDTGFNYKHMCNLVLKNTQTHLSYATVQKIEKTAEWAVESFRTHGKDVEAVVEVALKLKPAINQLKAIDAAELANVVPTLLVTALEAAILSKGIGRRQLFNHI
ncbi:hypothetical protein [Marinomonas fungiae]|uniref:Uncharacterized protein n=1 Tax=Marinomonas fungiae TaxID=1137284 RepID=A0A0K6IUH9_9GAMM|nr:hypothetical protein [Marinomonas fungiae]CUB06743.1 hypothetical protein Ga0061065_12146 [Marinomonas fungiae]